MEARRDDRSLTFADAASLDPDEQAGELDAGRFELMTRGTWRHGAVAANIVVLLKTYAKQNPGWSVATADPGAKLAGDPDVLRKPDVAIVRAERVPTGRGVDGWLDGAPDLAVEVVGDSQTHSDLARKALEYLRAGGKMVWVVDIDRARVVLYTAPDHVRVLGSEETLDGADALPGFRCRVAELFE
jgi:Uma2 family endonuclease